MKTSLSIYTYKEDRASFSVEVRNKETGGSKIKYFKTLHEARKYAFTQNNYSVMGVDSVTLCPKMYEYKSAY